VIPQGFIQDLLARADIVDVVGRAVQLKKAGINYKGLCPFHGEKTPSFIVSPSRQTYHCFGCGVHGNAVGFLMEHGGLGFVEAVKDLAGELGLSVPDDERDPRERERAAQARARQLSLVEVLGRACRHYRAQLKASPRAIAYLKGRGLTGEIAARYGLGYAPAGWHGLASAFGEYDDPKLVESGLVILQDDPGEQRRYDRFRDRIMFPIRNPKGEVIGFGGRVLDKGEPKYLNSPETPVFSKGRELYGLFEARAAIRQRGFILVTEGYMDVVALAQLGVGNAVATLGTACTEDHVTKLLRFAEQIVFSFDGDAAGRRAAARAMEAVLPHVGDTRTFRFLFLPAEHDPDSYIREHGAEAFERCIAEAVPLSRQLMAVVAEGCDLTMPEGRTRMLAQARPLFERLPEGLLKTQLLAELARDGGVSVEQLAQHWRLGAARPAPAAPPAAPAGPDGPPDWDDIPPADDAPRAPAADPSDPLGYDPRDDGTPAHRRFERDASRRRQGGGWRREAVGASMASPRAVPPRTATLLDQIAWVLACDLERWMTLPADLHDLLVQQPAPHGAFFAHLERVLHDEGALPAEDLIASLREDGADAGMQVLLARLGRLLALGSAPAEGDLAVLADRLRLEQVIDACTLLVESGPLSDEARERAAELHARRAALKSRLSKGAV
jgi:DNA primase